MPVNRTRWLERRKKICIVPRMESSPIVIPLIKPTDQLSLVKSGGASLLGREAFVRAEMTDAAGVIRRPRPFRVDDPTGSQNARYLLAEDGRIEIPDLLCLELNDATVIGDRGILAGDGEHLITDSNHLSHSVEIFENDGRRDFELVPLIKADGGYTLKSPAVPTVQLSTPTVLLSTMEENNYGAFLLRVIPKIIQAHSLGFTREKFLVSSRAGWQQTILKWAGVSADQLTDHDSHFAYLANNLIVPALRLPLFFMDDASVEFFQTMREKIGREYELPTGITPRVYVSRLGRSKVHPDHRVMMNESALIELMKERGFCIFEPEAHPFEIQTQVFGQADIVIGPGGSGMFNNVFCRPGTTVISLEPQIDWLTAHANIFASMGHQYGLVVGGSDPTDASPQKRWTTDLANFAKLLSDIC